MRAGGIIYKGINAIKSVRNLSKTNILLIVKCSRNNSVTLRFARSLAKRETKLTVANLPPSRHRYCHRDILLTV